MAMHILLSTEDPGVGGVAQYNHSLMCGLAQLGHKVTCLQPQTHNREALAKEENLGIKHLWLDNQTVNTLSQTFKDKSRSQPDLIICSNSNPFSNFAVKQIAIEFGIPFIVVEGLVEPYLADQYPKYLSELSYHYTQAKSVIAVSFDNLNLLYKFFHLPAHKGQVIYYGRPPEYFMNCDTLLREQLRKDLNIPSDAVVCFTSARIEPRKGYQYQLEAIKQLVHTDVWSNLYFVWAGAGIFAPQMEAELKETIEQLGITNKVILLGQQNDVSNWLNIADIFVFPSQLEGMPLCVMEAMAKGLPVIASAVSGIPEELGDSGKLLPDPKINAQATVRELVITIQDLVVNKQLRQSVGKTCQERAKAMFREERMIQETIEVIEKALLPSGDYISPNFKSTRPDYAFPNMVVADTSTCRWQYLRREIPHNWYVDERQPTIGFLSRDEAHILYNTSLKFKGKNALEIGCWLGWSACHMALAGVKLDVIDPVLSNQDFYESVSNSLKTCNIIDNVNLVGGYSPQKVEELAAHLQCKWSLIFIDGNHDAPGPLEDAIICEKFAEDDALILFHDLSSPDVAQGLDYLKSKGWKTMVYQTMQIMGVAWRGNVEPVEHQPDPKVFWQLPKHLQNYSVSGLSISSQSNEFTELFDAVRQYTLLSQERLFSLYSLAKKICLEDIPGNFVECGAFKGGASALVATIIKRYSKRPRLLYAFDTFEGMPEPTEFDNHNGIPANSTGFGEGTLKAPIAENLSVICKLLEVEDIVVPVQGLFANTLPEYESKIGSIALLHADGDWYESTMDILKNLYSNVLINGFVQVDDYGHWEGCRKAIHDFEIMTNEYFNLHQIDYTGVWFQKALTQEQVSPIVIVDGVFFQLYQTGIARVWKSLLEEWAKNTFGQHIVLLDRGNTAPKISGIKYRTIPAYDYSSTEADREMLQQICDQEGADVFISTYYTTPLTTPSVFMAHDMIPEIFGWNLNHPMWQEKHYGIQHAAAYITVSENTARDLVKCFSNIPVELIKVAQNGVNHQIFFPSNQENINQFKMKYGITKPYFILVGAGSGYKNSILFFKAFSQLASSNGFDIICTANASIIEPEFRACTSGSVIHTLKLSDEELATAYSGAIALVYPSKYEGFGLPILEAMACGCPVITCSNASIPEVAENAAIYVKDDDIYEMVDALCEVQKPSVRQFLISEGLAKAQNFSWLKMANVVSYVLLNVSLQHLKLRQNNLIIFPDWSQSEESISSELERVMNTISIQPNIENITLLIDTNGISYEEAELLVSATTMNLLMQENADVIEKLEISLVASLSSIQWNALLSHVSARIILKQENKQELAQVQAEKLPTYDLENYIISNVKVTSV